MAAKAQRWNFNVGAFCWKLMLSIGICGCLAWSQWAGWSVTGTMLADGGVKRTVQSTESNVASTHLKNLTAERAALVLPDKSKKALEGELKLERTRTSKTYKDGDGPEATKIKSKIAAIDRAAELDGEIEVALRKLKSAPTVAEGDVDVAIPVGLTQRFGWVDAEAKAEVIAADVRFWSIVFLVGMMGFFATFGFRMVGVSHDDVRVDLLWEKPIVWVPLIFLAVEAGMNATYGYRRAGGGFFNFSAYLQALMYAGVAVLGAFLPTQWDAKAKVTGPKPAEGFLQGFDWGPKQLGSGGAQQLHDELVAKFGPDVVAQHLPGLSRAARADAASESELWASEARQARLPPAPQEVPPLGMPPLSGRPPVFPPSIEPRSSSLGAPDARSFAGAPDAHAFGASAHGSPIAIHNHFSGAAPHAVGAPQLAPPSQTERDAPLHAAPAAEPATPAPALPPLLTGPPVDRGATQAKIDHLLLFKQACLVPMPGAIVSADDMYARYVAWAGQRCLNGMLFHALFGGLCDVPTSAIGDKLIYADIAVRNALPKEIAS